MGKSRIVIPRKVLLVEIERRCHVPACNAKISLGLTKNEARAYCGFTCDICDEWNDDALTEKDVPEWWEDISVTDLYAVRPTENPGQDDLSEVISRMSDGFQATTLGEPDTQRER